MTSHSRLKAALVAGVAAASLAGPSVLDAAAAARSHRAASKTTIARALKRAGVQSSAAPALAGALSSDDATAPPSGAAALVDEVVSELTFDVSPADLQAILADLPGFAPS